MCMRVCGVARRWAAWGVRGYERGMDSSAPGAENAGVGSLHGEEPGYTRAAEGDRGSRDGTWRRDTARGGVAEELHPFRTGTGRGGTGVGVAVARKPCREAGVLGRLRIFCHQ